MTRPLVSIVTPTWERPELLAETIQHVREQTYPNLEHVVVSDGQDERLIDMATEDTAEWYGHQDLRGDYPVRWHVLGRNWSGLMPESFGIAPLTVGYLLARGEYVMHLSDDDRIAPDYISRLVALLEETGADFAYTKARFYWYDERPEDGVDIGADPPEHGQITSFLFRASNLHRFCMPEWGTHPMDWALVKAWMRLGATWAFLPEVLFWHRADDESGRAR